MSDLQLVSRGSALTLAVMCALSATADVSSGLVDGWCEKFYDGLEAQGEVRSNPSGYCGKEPALEFRHVSGAKIFGAEKRVETKLTGAVAWTVSAAVKGSGSAEAGMAMEFFDKNGRSLGIQQGAGVKVGGEWTPHVWTFRSSAAAKTAFLHVLSLDAGPVSFARIAVSSAPGKESDALPLAAIPLPFSWNKDWNGGKYLFTSFADAPQPMAFHFKGDRGKLKGPYIELDLPDDMEIRDAFTEHDEFWGPEKPVSETVHTRGGAPYRRLRYADVRVFKILNPAGYGWERKLTLVPAPKQKADWTDKTYRCYWRLGDETRTNTEAALDIRFVALPQGLRMPKSFEGLSWQSDDRLYSDDATFLAAAKAWEMSGMTSFVRRRTSFKRNVELIELLKARPVKWRFIFTFPDLWGTRFLAPSTPEYKALNAPLAVWTDGRESRKLCPDYFNNDPDFAAYFRDRIVHARLKGAAPEDGDLIGFDFEPWGSSQFCVCDRCRAAYAKHRGLVSVPTVEEATKDVYAWAEFRCDQTEASVAKICNAVREYNPKLLLADYDYIQFYGAKDEKVFYTGCAKNTRQDERWFDRHICSYYHMVDRKSFLAISNNTSVLKKPYLPLGAVGGYGGYLRAGEVRTPNQIRLLALAAAVHGCPGIGFYEGLHYDGEHLLALMKARDAIAAVEDLPWGRRPGTLNVVSANPELAVARCAADGREAVALFNYDPKSPAHVRISSATGLIAVATDPVARKDLSGRIDLKNGFDVSVPPEDVVLVVFALEPQVAVEWTAEGLLSRPEVVRRTEGRGPLSVTASFYDSTSTGFLGTSKGTLAADGRVAGRWPDAETNTTYRTFLTVADAKGTILYKTEESSFSTDADPELAIDYVTGRNFDAARAANARTVAEVQAIGETAELQRRIDEASARGGGVVTVGPGDHPITSIFLKDNVTLELARGARLYAATTNRDDYLDAVLKIPGDSRRRQWRDCCTALVCGNGVTNVALVGEGTLDGCCERLNDLTVSPGRYRNVVLYRCRGVRLENVTLKDAARWTCYFKECENVVARRVKIRSLKCWGNDGFDIESRHVLIEDCDIEADDDAICLKNFNPEAVVEDVEVRNCRIAANCDHIKIGTETFGGFRDIRIRDCELVKCSTNVIPQIKTRSGANAGIPGWDPNDICSRCGIALECVDGGFVENVRISGIRMDRSAQTPIFIRLGERRENAQGRTPYLRDVVIEDVTGAATSQIASSVTGVPGLRPSDITFRNVRLRLMGGATAEDARRPVPEAEKAYPENKMFDRHMLPAYGFYVRHADRVKFENVVLTADRPDVRPDIVLDDVGR